MFLKAYDAFLNKCKPSYFCAHMFAGEFKHLVDSGYPSACIIETATLFFASDELKNRFIAKSKELDFHSPEYKELLGVALGYPPVAARYFADTMRNPDLEKQGAMYQYCGRYFGGNIDDTQVISEWLWGNVANYPPSEILMTYQDKNYRLLPGTKSLL